MSNVALQVSAWDLKSSTDGSTCTSLTADMQRTVGMAQQEGQRQQQQHGLLVAEQRPRRPCSPPADLSEQAVIGEARVWGGEELDRVPRSEHVAGQGHFLWLWGQWVHEQVCVERAERGREGCDSGLGSLG